jgi:hypothetical protein
MKNRQIRSPSTARLPIPVQVVATIARNAPIAHRAHVVRPCYAAEKKRLYGRALARWATVSWVRRVAADLPAHRSSEQLPASANRSTCRAAVRGTATHRPDQAASHHGRAVGGASASRNQRFESIPLQRRVMQTIGSSAAERGSSRSCALAFASGDMVSAPAGGPVRKSIICGHSVLPKHRGQIRHWRHRAGRQR